MRKLFSLVFIWAVILCGLLLVSPQPAKAAGSAYDITSYHTDIQIGKDNTYHVTETISVEFQAPKHGILRAVPYIQEMAWEEYGNMTYHTKVEQVQVSGAPFKTYTENGNLIIQIGDPDVYQTGPVEYQISYDHVLGNDKINAQDFVYYDLIGTNWDCSIQNASFSVTLPESFDADKVWFFAGSYGNAGNADVSYSVNGNTIAGSFNGTLAPGEGLTLQVDLPEGYFTVPPSFPWQEVLMVLALVLTVVSLLLFLLFGRDGRLVTPVELYAPEGITSAEAGYIIDTITDDKDVVSLVLYWAAQGYLSIERVAEENFKLNKLKELPETAQNYEKHMFQQLFYERDSVKISELKENFYATIDTTKELLADHYDTKANRLYSAGSQALGGLIRFLMSLLIGFSLAVASYEATYSAAFAAVVAVVGIILVLTAFTMLRKAVLRWQGLRRVQRSAMLIWGCILLVLFIIGYMAYMAVQGMAMAGIVIAGVTILSGVISLFMRKRTKRGSELLGRLLGFKNFLERAEKSRIERLVEEHPSYFYDVMPFAYVLGVTDKWAKKFEGMAVRPPDWYHDSYGPMDTFSPLIFQAYMFRSMAFMHSTMASRPAPQMNTTGSGSGGGSFGGGGFSGGGFGGGGGSSW